MKNVSFIRFFVFSLFAVGIAGFAACGSSAEIDPPVNPALCPDILELGGTLSEDLTVYEIPQDCSSHLLTSNLTVTAGAVLTIEPGAQIEARSNLFIRADKEGAIVAVGTADKPILFTAVDPVLGWMGLNFFNAERSENHLEHVIVEYAGSSKQLYASEPASISLTSNQPISPRVVIKNSIIRDGLGNGVEFSANAIVPEFSNNTIRDHAGRAAYVQGSSAHWLDSSSSFSPNAIDEVFVKAFPGISEDVTWDSLDAVYVVDGTLNVNAHLTIEPGAVLSFRSNATLHVLGQDAALTAAGTTNQPIIFTAQQATPGYWRGIAFSNATSENNILEHVMVEYAGQGNQPGAHQSANVSIGYTVDSTPSRVTVRQSMLRHSAECGLSVARKSVAISVLEGNSYEGNVIDECIQQPL